MPQCASGERN
ncbi:hypothetical protein YPPY60_4317, partial [Yersinia pestis PY-60]